MHRFLAGAMLTVPLVHSTRAEKSFLDRPDLKQPPKLWK
jgi:hypothetical protein